MLKSRFAIFSQLQKITQTEHSWIAKQNTCQTAEYLIKIFKS